MIAAADAVAAAGVVDAGVVRGGGARQLREQVAGEPRERLRATHGADRHFVIVAAPTALERAPGSRETISQKRSALELNLHLRPESLQQRLIAPGPKQIHRLVAKSPEKGRILNGSLFVGNFTGPVIEWDRRGVRPRGLDCGGRGDA